MIIGSSTVLWGLLSELRIKDRMRVTEKSAKFPMIKLVYYGRKAATHKSICRVAPSFDAFMITE